MISAIHLSCDSAQFLFLLRLFWPFFFASARFPLRFEVSGDCWRVSCLSEGGEETIKMFVMMTRLRFCNVPQLTCSSTTLRKERPKRRKFRRQLWNKKPWRVDILFETFISTSRLIELSKWCSLGFPRRNTSPARENVGGVNISWEIVPRELLFRSWTFFSAGDEKYLREGNFFRLVCKRRKLREAVKGHVEQSCLIKCHSLNSRPCDSRACVCSAWRRANNKIPKI